MLAQSTQKTPVYEAITFILAQTDVIKRMTLYLELISIFYVIRFKLLKWT